MARHGLIGIVAVLLVVNKAVSYLRELSLARVFGAGSSFDAYAVAIAVAGIVFGLIGNSLSTVLIPAIKAAEVGGRREWEKAVTTTLGLSLILLAASALAQALLAHPLVSLVAPGLSPATAAMAAHLLVLMAPATAMMGYWIVAGGLLNTADEFALPIYVPVVLDIALLSTVLLLGGRVGISAATWGLMAGAVLQTVILRIALARRGFVHRRGMFDWTRATHMLRLASPVAVTVLLSQGLLVLDKYYASSMGPGVISCMHYSILVTNIPIGVFGVAVSTVVFPVIAEGCARGDFPAARAEANRAVMVSFAIGLASCAVMWLGAHPIVKLLFGRGEFGPNAVSMTAEVVRYQSIMIPTVSAAAVLERAYYALGRNLRPLAGIVGGIVAFVATQSVVSWLAPGVPGHVRIGMGYSAYGVANLALLAQGYRKLFPPEPNPQR